MYKITVKDFYNNSVIRVYEDVEEVSPSEVISHLLIKVKAHSSLVPVTGCEVIIEELTP